MEDIKKMAFKSLKRKDNKINIKRKNTWIKVTVQFKM